MKYINYGWLEERQLCETDLSIFREQFGVKGIIEDVFKYLHEKDLKEWEGWLLAQSLPTTKIFVEKGANIHADDDYALRLAAESGHLKVVQFLVERSRYPRR